MTDPRMQPKDLELTGTLPIQGAEMPASKDAAAPTDDSVPAFVTEARDALTTPGKYLIFEFADLAGPALIPIRHPVGTYDKQVDIALRISIAACC